MTRDNEVGYEIVIQTAERMIEHNQKIIREHEARIKAHKESILLLRNGIDQEIFKKIEAKKAMKATDK